MTVTFWIVGYDVRMLVYVRTFAMSGRGKQTVIKVWPFKGFANKNIQSLGVMIYMLLNPVRGNLRQEDYREFSMH